MDSCYRLVDSRSAYLDEGLRGFIGIGDQVRLVALGHPPRRYGAPIAHADYARKHCRGERAPIGHTILENLQARTGTALPQGRASALLEE